MTGTAREDIPRDHGMQHARRQRKASVGRSGSDGVQGGSESVAVSAVESLEAAIHQNLLPSLSVQPLQQMSTDKVA